MNKLTHLIYLIILSSFYAHAQPNEKVHLKKGVYVKNNAIFYVGHLSKEYNDEFFSLYNKNKNKITEIDINSGGGSINLGMDLGDFIYNHKLNVTIPDYCFSSCANYVFPSGNIKKISSHTLIGYHGGAYSPTVDMFLESEKRRLGRSLTEQEKDKYTKKYSDIIKKGKNRQDLFYSKRKINKKIASLGKDAFPDIHYNMVYYPLKDFSTLGVNNIEVIDNKRWAPKDRGKIIVRTKSSQDFSQNTENTLILFELELNDLKKFNISLD